MAVLVEESIHIDHKADPSISLFSIFFSEHTPSASTILAAVLIIIR
jgi:hypothetical protein